MDTKEENNDNTNNIVLAPNPYSSFMPFTKITSGKFEIVQTGVILLPENGSNLLFNINGFEMNIKFINNVEPKKPRTHVEKISDKKIELICDDWEYSEDRGIVFPYHVFSFGDIKIYFKMFVKGRRDIPYVIYTFYRLLEY